MKLAMAEFGIWPVTKIQRDKQGNVNAWVGSSNQIMENRFNKMDKNSFE